MLTTNEKRYLRAVIKPFYNRVKYISKCKLCYKDNWCFIYIDLDDDSIELPVFHIHDHYKGMELEKQYSLKELEI